MGGEMGRETGLSAKWSGECLAAKAVCLRLLVAFRLFVFSHLAARTYGNPVFIPASVSRIQTRERMATATSFRDSRDKRPNSREAKSS